MLDFLKNLTKSDEEKQQELVSAYLDGTLSQSQRQAFETQLAQDADLRAEVELAQLIRQQMSEMPRRSVPRSFTLNPNIYGVPQKQPLVQAYPFLRAATVLTAFFFVFALGLSLFTTQGGGNMASVAQTAMEPAPAMEAPMAESEIAFEDAEDAALEEAAEEIIVESEVVEEAEEMAADTMPLATMPPAITESKETAVEEAFEEEEAMAADEGVFPAEAAPNEPLDGAAAESGMGELATATLIPTATASSLPRPDATETAVSRLAEPTTLPPDELANAIETATAVEQINADLDTAPTSRGLSTMQWLLIGLGLLLLFLVIVTLLARRHM
jgi:hypothetical protein